MWKIKVVYLASFTLEIMGKSVQFERQKTSIYTTESRISVAEDHWPESPTPQVGWAGKGIFCYCYNKVEQTVA